MTNFLAMITVTLLTNSTESLHPSGSLKLITSVVYEHHESAAYYWNDRRIVMSTNIPIATNITRLTWQPEVIVPKIQRIPNGPMKEKNK